MAYKVVCTKCGRSVRLKAKPGCGYWYLACKCQESTLYYLPFIDWKIEVSGKVSKEEALKYCVGCYENIYNGNNTVGVKECWNLKSAKLVMKKKVGIDDVPPWNHIPIKCLSCYHENGFVMIDAKDRR